MVDRVFTLVAQKDWPALMTELPKAPQAQIRYRDAEVGQGVLCVSEYGTDILKLLKYESTPLHEACIFEAPPEIIRLLIERGAVVSATRGVSCACVC
jgi:hypothetical protein